MKKKFYKDKLLNTECATPPRIFRRVLREEARLVDTLRACRFRVIVCAANNFHLSLSYQRCVTIFMSPRYKGGRLESSSSLRSKLSLIICPCPLSKCPMIAHAVTNHLPSYGRHIMGAGTDGFTDVPVVSLCGVAWGLFFSRSRSSFTAYIFTHYSKASLITTHTIEYNCLLYIQDLTTTLTTT